MVVGSGYPARAGQSIWEYADVRAYLLKIKAPAQPAVLNRRKPGLDGYSRRGGGGREDRRDFSRDMPSQKRARRKIAPEYLGAKPVEKH